MCTPAMRHASTIIQSEKLVMSRRKMSKVRFALPFMVKCLKCSVFSGRFTRHNAWKETLKCEKDTGQEVYRFIFKCKSCKKMQSIVTSPLSGMYCAEFGCVSADSSTPTELKSKTHSGKAREEEKDLLLLEEEALLISSFSWNSIRKTPYK